jgi:hypothetical protein
MSLIVFIGLSALGYWNWVLARRVADFLLFMMVLVIGSMWLVENLQPIMAICQ